MTPFEEELLPVQDEAAEPLVRSFATIGAVYADGVSLIFDGEDEPTEKHYLCNTNVYFSAGDRVRILEDSGTYIVEYVVGAPRQTQLAGLPAGGTTGQTLAKTSDADFAAGWSDAPHELPTGGSNGQILSKDGSANYAVKWANAPEGVPSGGSNGQVLTKTASGFGWSDAPHELPTGGANGQLLAKNGTTNYAVHWVDQPPAAKIRNPANGSYPDSDSYVIQFRTKNYYGSDAGILQFRMGTSGNWITLANV